MILIHVKRKPALHVKLNAPETCAGTSLFLYPTAWMLAATHRASNTSKHSLPQPGVFLGRCPEHTQLGLESGHQLIGRPLGHTTGHLRAATLPPEPPEPPEPSRFAVRGGSRDEHITPPDPSPSKGKGKARVSLHTLHIPNSPTEN